jgi:hypothetical protein
MFFGGPMALGWRSGELTMPERFTSGLYGPDLVKVMGEALDLALANFRASPPEAKKILADVIIECVDAGEREPEVLAAEATAALEKAIDGGLISE